MRQVLAWTYNSNSGSTLVHAAVTIRQVRDDDKDGADS